MRGLLPAGSVQRLCGARPRRLRRDRHHCISVPQRHSAGSLAGREDFACCSAATLDVPTVAVPVFPAPEGGHFSKDMRKFVEQHRIRGNEVGPDQRASIVTVANLLQEIAGNHAVGLWGRTDSGFASLPSMKDVIFVMTRLQIRMDKYPKCTWVTINVETRRIIKLPEAFTTFLQFSAHERGDIPKEETRRKLPDLPDVSLMVAGPEQIARRADMDMNGHINNVTYLAWALETIPASVYESFYLREVEVDFKAECQAGQEVESHGMQLLDHSNGDGRKQEYLHTLRRCDENGCYELVRARTTWKGR